MKRCKFLITITLIVSFLISGCGLFSSPEKEIESLVGDYLNQLAYILDSDPNDLTEKDIEKFAKLYIPERQDEIYNGFLKQVKQKRNNPNKKSKNGMTAKEELKDFRIEYLNPRAENIQDSADIRVLFKPKNSSGPNSSHFVVAKVNGKWYVVDSN